MNEIANDKLTPTDIPAADADWTTIGAFALSYNGYKKHGSFEACSEIANTQRAESLDDLRTCLFFEQRRWHHFGDEPDGESMEYIRGLVERIRTYVAAVNVGATPTKTARPLDTQVVEILGRNRLVGDLLRDGLEVAIPARDRGIDLIAYADLSQKVTKFVARPIQMKAFTTSGISLERKYTRIVDLILAYVWNVGDAHSSVTYALTYPQMEKIADTAGWTRTASWLDNGKYSVTRPGKELVKLLEPYRMESGKWWFLVVGNEPILPPAPDEVNNS